MAGLVALDLAAGTQFVDVLRRVWERGDAAFPLDQRLPQNARHAVLRAAAPTSVVDSSGDEVVLPGGRSVESGDALVVTTSGSTGEPRAVVLTHDAVRASALASLEGVTAVDGDHWLACLPLSHVGGLSVVTRALAGGHRLTVVPRPDADAVADAVRHGANMVSLVPTLLGRIDVTPFRRVLLGGAAPPGSRPDNVIATYGLTESGSGVVYDGWPLRGVEISIRPDGHILLRGPMMLRAYRDGTEPFDDAGWFDTGDIGTLGSDGRLTVFGRDGEMIITGGENVWPAAVERAITACPAVAEVAVSGRPDPDWGQVVVAWVVPNDATRPPTLDELREFGRPHLAPFALPRSLRIVDRLPRTGSGKVVRGRLT